jgi:RNA polymerase sigma factor (sigma-70 family)
MLIGKGTSKREVGDGDVEREAHFEALYLELYHKLLGYAARGLEGNLDLAEEAVQDTFRIFWVKYDQATVSPNVRGWIVNTLKGEILNIRRTRARMANLVVQLSTAPQVEAVARDEHGLDVEYSDLQHDPDYRLLCEFALEQQTVKELAQSRGITIAACKKRLERARKRLKKYFEEMGGSGHLSVPSERRINERGS